MDTAWIYNACHRADDRSSEGEKTKKAGLSSPVTLVCLTWFWHLLKKKKRESQYQQVRCPQKPVFFRPLLDHTCKSWVSSEDRWWHIMFVSGRQLEVWVVWRTTLTSPSLQLRPSLCVLPLNPPLFSISSQARLLSSLARTSQYMPVHSFCLHSCAYTCHSSRVSFQSTSLIAAFLQWLPLLFGSNPKSFNIHTLLYIK